MAFTSISTIYASLALPGAVMISTWFPAKVAMEISAPSEDAGWTLPPPTGDRLSFDLPFYFRTQGRIAVISFLYRYLLAHGEGGTGHFSVGEPSVHISSEDNPADSTRTEEGQARSGKTGIVPAGERKGRGIQPVRTAASAATMASSPWPQLTFKVSNTQMSAPSIRSAADFAACVAPLRTPDRPTDMTW